MSIFPVADAARPGLLMAIGGAEDKVHNRDVLRRFVAAAGGRRGRIAIFPTASQLDDTGHRYAELFRDLDAAETHIVTVADRAAAVRESERIVEMLQEATGVFFSGGNQVRLSTILGGTKIASTLRHKHAMGTVIAGTSAGAAILSEHMIAFGQSGSRVSHGMVTLAPGLGLTNRVIIDQHFRQRDRLGRLLTALAYNPAVIGLGVDEDTAALLDEHNVVHVVGSGTVTVVDTGGSTWTNADQIATDTPLAMLGLSLNILTPGCTFNLDERRAYPPPVCGVLPQG